MTDQITAAIAAIQNNVGTLTPPIAFNPDVPTETALVMPFVMCYPRQGDMVFESAGFGDLLVTLYVDFHIARNLLASTAKQAWEYIIPFIKTLITDPTLAGTVSEVNAVRFSYGGLQWNQQQDDIGVRFELDVKLLVQV